MSQSSETYVRHPIAIAILGYDRPHYLTQVLDSLAPQLGELDQVYLFQDGAWNPHSGITKTDPELIEECCMVFSRITFYVHEYLIRLLPEEVEAMRPPHLRGGVSPSRSQSRPMGDGDRARHQGDDEKDESGHAAPPVADQKRYEHEAPEQD